MSKSPDIIYNFANGLKRWGFKRLTLLDRARLLFKPWVHAKEMYRDGGKRCELWGKELDGYIIILKERFYD